MRLLHKAIVLAAFSACITPAFATQTANLLVNGDAELGQGSDSGDQVAVPGWNVNGNATAVKYDAAGGFPAQSDPGPVNRGLNFFAGGPSNQASSMSQLVDLHTWSSAINSGQTRYDFAAWLGGYSGQNDHATLTITFLGANGQQLGDATLNPVFAQERGGRTGLIERHSNGFVPVGALSANVVLNLSRTDGSYNDGYADNLSFAITPVPEAETWMMLGGGLALLGAMVRRRKR